MTNTTKVEYPIKPITSIDDDQVLMQLPINVREQLGQEVESGFHLFLHRRDLFFENGLVQYVLGETTAHVELD